MSGEANGVAIPTPSSAGTQTGTTNQGDPKQAAAGGHSQSGQTQNPTSEEKQAAREAIRRLKIKNDDGAEEEVDEDEVIKVYKDRKRHQSVAARELNEGKQAKQKADAFFQMMKDKQKLFDTIKELGHDPRALSEEFLASQLEEEMLDPREKEFRSLKKELDARKQREADEKTAQEKKLHDDMIQRFSKKYTEEFVEVLKTSRLPQNKHTIGKMADYIKKFADLKMEISPKEAAQLVRQDFEDVQRATYNDMEVDELVKFLGEGNLQKIRQWEVAKLRNPETHLRTPKEQADIKPRSKPTGERMSHADWRKFNRG